MRSVTGPGPREGASRGRLNFTMELRWDGVPSLTLALEMLREQARRTPPPSGCG